MSDDLNTLLREGIAAARSGQREKARALLGRLVERDEQNVLAWLWLSGVVESMEDRQICLENVLALDPNNQTAQQGLARLRQQQQEQWLREGIEAAKAGRRESARERLTRVVEQDEGNVTAWLWLSGVVESPDEREACLENVLALDPENEAARRGLELLRAETGAPSVEEAGPAEGEPPPFVSAVAARASTPISPAAAILRERFARQAPPPPAPPPPSASPWDDLSNELLCPYCAAPTQPDDRRCQACGQKLWVEYHRREKPSTLFWIVLALQLINTLYLLAAPLTLLISIGFLIGVMDPLELLNIYLGLPTSLPPEVVHTALRALPRFVFFSSLLPFIFSLVILIGLYVRWRPIYYLFLADAILEFIFALLVLILTPSILGGLIVLGFALLRLVFVFQLGEDFAYTRERIFLRVELATDDVSALLTRGEAFARRKMWALAALHLRRASAWTPDKIGSRLALAVACIRLKRYDLAQLALDEARRISPDNPSIAEIQAVVDAGR